MIDWWWFVVYAIPGLFVSRAYWTKYRPVTSGSARLEDLSYETLFVGLVWPLRLLSIGFRWFFNSKVDALRAREDQYRQSLAYWESIKEDKSLLPAERDLAAQNLEVLKESRGES